MKHLAAIDVEVVEHPDRDSYRAWLADKSKDFGPRGSGHTSSPVSWLGDNDYLGGCDDTLAWIRSNFMSGGNPDRAMRATHDNDADAAGEYEFDLVVIGGGSGGLACSKQAAEHGASVAVVDFVTPSKHGSTWGLGGTCVNVGCIPKKLMHNTALLGENLADARSFGWQLPETASHDWSTMVTGIQDHIRSLNFGYRVQLRQKGVTYKNALAKFVDPHTLELTDKKGKTSTLTARRVVIAVGGRPRELDIPGGELAINSDDIFSLSTAPGKTLVIGASYVALECAGFLTALGYDTTVMVRSILLRGFDREIADMIGEAMKHHGTKFAMQTSPTAIEKLDDGRLKVTSKGADGDEVEEVYDTVFCATGRVPITKALNLEAAGVTARPDGKIDAVNEQTNVPHIYAIGDVLYNRPELTPVAIAAGKLLASRLYNGATKAMDYESIATTVFTPLEYGAIGLSEEDAIAKYGEANVEVYHSKFTPLEWTVPEHRHEVQAFAKLVVNKADNNRVVGFHYAGPNAGEVTQGFSVAIKMGATYENFHSTIGIHPTVAEEFTTMDVTKSSGASADKGGC